MRLPPEAAYYESASPVVKERSVANRKTRNRTRNRARTLSFSPRLHYSLRWMTDALILAGGAGTRLWPASLPNHPKQFLDFGEGTLLSQTVTRAASAVDGRILIVTAVQQLDDSRRCLENHPASDRLLFLGEPCARNTLPAIALGVHYLSQESAGKADADTCTLVMPADHRIRDVERFASDVAAAHAAAAEGNIVIFGVTPTKPATGYGYIEVGDPLGDHAAPVARRVESFREKPDEETAAAYIASGYYLWNAGLFLFANATFKEELARCARTTADGIGALGTIDLENASSESPIDEARYAALPAQSIDHGIMERSARSAVVPVGFDWTDIGSWDELAAIGLPGLQSGGMLADIESSGNYVFSDMPVALCGVHNLSVVVKNGVVLICERGKSEYVRKAAEIAHKAR